MTLEANSPNHDLIARLMPAVERMARSQGRKYPSADVRELVQIGAIGLLEAARRHRGDASPADGFAIRRIRGAMQDFVRAQDPLTRRQRRAMRRLEVARRRVAQRLAREPRASQVAADAGVTLEDYARIVRDGALPRSRPNADDVRSELPDAHTSLQRLEARKRLSAALDRLDARLRDVIVSHYIDGTSFDVIRERLGVSAGRVSQLHRQALDRLRSALREAYVS
jgi:RNA polymerase sigma factor for flagellar operon FliA